MCVCVCVSHRNLFEYVYDYNRKQAVERALKRNVFFDSHVPVWDAFAQNNWDLLQSELGAPFTPLGQSLKDKFKSVVTDTLQRNEAYADLVRGTHSHTCTHSHTHTHTNRAIMQAWLPFAHRPARCVRVSTRVMCVCVCVCVRSVGTGCWPHATTSP